MSFLHTAKYTPRMHLVFKGFTLFFITYWVVDIFKPMSLQILRIIFNVVILTIFPFYFYVAVQAYRQGFKSALFYLLAWGIFLLTAVWLILSNLDILPPTFFINYQLQIGAVFEMLLLSFALTHRIKILEEEKFNTQGLLLNSLQQNEQKLKQQKADLEGEMQERNHDLQSKQEEILRQNEELLAQQEEMQRQKSIIEQQNIELALQNRRMKANEAVLQKAYFKLTEAQKTIQSKNDELKKYSENLESQIQERTEQIAKANLELVKQNNQLEQFAFITAHNLRSPVARILGLANILDTKNLHNPDNQFVLDKIVVVAHELETVIKDLNIILDIKKGINQIIEVVKFSEKLEKVKALLQNQIQDSKAQIEADFSQIDAIQSVSPYMESIMYNLLSNAIKYRNPKKVPLIKVKTEVQMDYVVLSVADNGLGIDLEANKGKIFTLYRRFHDHVEGKGLGLYLIKTQMETLGGKVEITSKLGEGTTFYIFFPKRLA
jgi:signal transduction histidine kinase